MNEPKKEIRDLEARLAIAIEALSFYADTETYNVDCGDVAYDDDFECFTIDADEETGNFPGKRARQALKQIEEK